MAIHIRRRELLAALGDATAWPLMARGKRQYRRGPSRTGGSVACRAQPAGLPVTAGLVACGLLRREPSVWLAERVEDWESWPPLSPQREAGRVLERRQPLLHQLLRLQLLEMAVTTRSAGAVQVPAMWAVPRRQWLV
jgi:hypothetical protein